MIRILALLLILFCCGQLQAQQLDDLKNGNTFFILFEEDAFSQKMKTLPKILEPIFYTFYYQKKNSNEKTPYSFIFSYHKFKLLEDVAANKQTISFRVHKSFLKKNKKLILSKSDIDALGEYRIIQLFKYKRKHIFLIDKAETIGDQILIRQVKFNFQAYE